MTMGCKILEGGTGGGMYEAVMQDDGREPIPHALSAVHSIFPRTVLQNTTLQSSHKHRGGPTHTATACAQTSSPLSSYTSLHIFCSPGRPLCPHIAAPPRLLLPPVLAAPSPHRTLEAAPCTLHSSPDLSMPVHVEGRCVFEVSFSGCAWENRVNLRMEEWKSDNACAAAGARKLAVFTPNPRGSHWI